MGGASARGWGWAVPITLAAAVVTFVAAAPAVGEVEAARSDAVLTVPDVPFVAQPESLCGGAALAMVLRYWGERDAAAEQFAKGLSADRRGISPEALALLAEERGYRTIRFQGEPGSVRTQLDRGWPVIALRSSGAGRYHYVVLLAWRGGSVLLHDPSEGPFRVVEEKEWLRASGAAQAWAVLVLPSVGTANTGGTLAADEPVPEGEGPRDAAPLEPERAARPWREQASLAFRQESWLEAAQLATRALEPDPNDAATRRLLATSLYLAGRRDDALGAWNALGEPRVSDLRLEGLVASRYRDVYDLLALPPGTLLDLPRLERARRRLHALPAVQAARITYRPTGGGSTEVQAHVLERPAFPRPSRLLLDSGLRSLESGAIAGSARGLTARGDSWAIGFSWREVRSELGLSASAPGALGLPGLVSTSVLIDAQSYATPGHFLREQHRGAALAFGHWWTANLRTEMRTGYDHWSGFGSHLSLGLDVDRRAWTDRLSLRAATFAWLPLEGTAPFLSGSLQLAGRTTASPGRFALRGELSYDFTAARAPRGIWPGAGTGQGRGRLLRAHPLLDDGVLSGPAFGPALLRAGVEGEAHLVTLAGVRLSAALFADSARVADPAARAARSFVDIGSGLRLHLPGGRTSLRLDAALPATGGKPQLSFGVMGAWPN